MWRHYECDLCCTPPTAAIAGISATTGQPHTGRRRTSSARRSISSCTTCRLYASLSGTGEGSEVRCEERALFTQSPIAFPHFAGSFCSICNDLSSASIPTLGRVLPSIRSLIALCEKQRVAAAADPRNADAEHILLAARDEYTAYFAEWTSNDLLLAATLIDPSQATDYFLSHPGGAVSAVAALAQAWAALDKLAQDLTAPPPPAGGGAAPGGAAVGIAAVSLAELLAGVQGGGAAAGRIRQLRSLTRRPRSSHSCPRTMPC